MPAKSSPKASRISIKTPKAKAKIKTVMEEFKEGELPIGKSSKKVTNPKQAIAIALNEARKTKKKKKAKKH